jgi:hypothetical protein
MDSTIEHVNAWMGALAFALGMLAFWAIGWRRGLRMPVEAGDDPGTKFTDASMAILGLLLAFTFSMSLGRHDQRRAAVVADSNAIGDFYTCATLLKEPSRSKLQAVIKEYARHRLDTGRELPTDAEEEKALKRCQEMHGRMTEIVGAALAEEKQTPIAVPLTNTLNTLTSSNASRFAAYRERLPWSIVGLLLLGSIVPTFLLGQQQGVSRRLNPIKTVGFIFLVTLVIYVTLDLNQPGRGLITVNQQPLEQLLETM